MRLSLYLAAAIVVVQIPGAMLEAYESGEWSWYIWTTAAVIGMFIIAIDCIRAALRISHEKAWKKAAEDIASHADTIIKELSTLPARGADGRFVKRGK